MAIYLNLIDLMKSLFIKILFMLKLHHIFRNIAQKGKVSVLLFHECDKDVFRKSVIYFKKYYNIISLKDYLENNNLINNHQKPFLILTFDDGCASNYHLLETVKKYKIPVTIFLIYNYINSESPFWWNLNGPTSTQVEDMKTISNNKRLSVINVNLDNKFNTNTRDSLNIKEIKEMIPFFDFQSHTLSHPILTNCTKKTIEDEIISSKKLLESLLDKKVSHFAYPNGNYNSNIIDQLKKTDYESAVTVNHGFNDIKPKSKYEIKRIIVGPGTDYLVTITNASGVYASLKRYLGL